MVHHVKLKETVVGNFHTVPGHGRNIQTMDTDILQGENVSENYSVENVSCQTELILDAYRYPSWRPSTVFAITNQSLRLWLEVMDCDLQRAEQFNSAKSPSIISKLRFCSDFVCFKYWGEQRLFSAIISIYTISCMEYSNHRYSLFRENV